MKKLLIGTAAAALIALPGLGMAQFNYTAIEAGIVDVEFDLGPFAIDGDGYSFGGTFEIGDNFFAGGSYADYDFDLGGSAEFLEVVGGYFHPLKETLDFVATLSYLDAEIGVGGDDDGLGIGAGMRTAVGESFEVDAMLEFVDFDAGGSDTGVELRGRYYFSEDFTAFAQTDFGKDFDTLQVGIRFEF